MGKEDKLEVIKNRFEEEGQFGDLAEAGRNAGVTGTTVSNGLGRQCFQELKDGERKGVLELLKILNKRKKEEAAIEAELNK